jgi:hypothetical protein
MGAANRAGLVDADDLDDDNRLNTALTSIAIQRLPGQVAAALARFTETTYEIADALRPSQTGRYPLGSAVDLDPTASSAHRGYIAAHLGGGLYLIEPAPDTDPTGSGDLFTAVDDDQPNPALRPVILRPASGDTGDGS